MKFSLYAIFTAVVVLFAIGCSSSTPSVNDFQNQITPLWASCSAVKPINFKKINGIPSKNPNHYQLDASYDLEFQQDISNVMEGFPNCKDETMYFLIGLVRSAGMAGAPIKKGNSLAIHNTFEMIQSEKGWVLE